MENSVPLKRQFAQLIVDLALLGTLIPLCLIDML